MVEYAKSFGTRTVIFTSGIKRPNHLSQEEIDFYINEMNVRLLEIEEHEPWNSRLKQNIRNFYEKFINPQSFSSITKEELSRLKKIGLDKIVFDFQAYEHETDKYLMGRNREKHSCLLDSLLNASFIGIETDVHFIPMKPNYKEIPKEHIEEAIEKAKTL